MDRLIDFVRAEVITPMIYPPQPRLVVSGVKPHPDVEVTLVPLTYVSRPPYHGGQSSPRRPRTDRTSPRRSPTSPAVS